jgi:dipeptidyl-peptidase-4
MVLHELAHAYHDQVLGHDHEGILEAFRAAVKGGQYESVLHFDGREKRAYALENDLEYFAEGTEAFFGTNDAYPFVRAELLRHDPKLFEVLQEVWGVGDVEE